MPKAVVMESERLTGGGIAVKAAGHTGGWRSAFSWLSIAGSLGRPRSVLGHR